MNELSLKAASDTNAALGDVIKLAVLAVGGQGGGVLGNWIEATARSQGWACQATSVAGVAQRTGSTIYYIEMAPRAGGEPVFSLMPSPGDVDIVVGAEMMEAGRAIMRGFVTPDRTMLIASSHRVVSIAEKTVPGDGISGPEDVRAAAEIAAHKLFITDLDKVATDNGSVISASLFGALAGSGALPFDRSAFEQAIEASGRGVQPSLRAFAAAFDLAAAGVNAPTPLPAYHAPAGEPQAKGPTHLQTAWTNLTTRIDALPEPIRPMAIAGLRKVVDFQDTTYAAAYLDRVEHVLGLDSADKDWTLSREAAKYIANAMAYDDVIRVADLKTRGTRTARVAEEVAPADGALMHITEFMHPRAEEIVGLFPARMGKRWSDNPKRMAQLTRLFNKGRRVRTDSLIGFLMLYVLGGLRSWRLRTLRHAQEVRHLEVWLTKVNETAASDYALAVEILRCRRLIKGYSDTHARGNSKFDRVVGAVPQLTGRDDAADWLRRLREAALQDEKGAALDGALKTVASFTQPAA
ncbi:MAG: indolepyruvate oxidoreductase subunit beta family protein [Marinibacterium sp.]|nr:indolepyruvate oxidoreductase subunit beta family protein [Marinibacterium sp.]